MERDEKIKILQDLIKINTINDNEAKIANYIQKLFATHGIESTIIAETPERRSLVAEIGQGKDERILAFSGHEDTVAISDPSKWSYDPFGATIVGDKLYGRGAADMKSGLAAQVIALIELVDENKLPAGTVRFMDTVGEEYGAQGANKLTKQGYSKDLSALLLSEPTSGNVIYAHSGSLNYRIKSYGVAAHSSEPSRGINAITNLVKYINIEPHIFSDTPEDPILGKVSHSITVIKGGDQVNSIPEFASLMGNIRPTKAFDNEKVISLLKETINSLNQEKDVQLEFELVHNFYPVATNPDNSFVQLVAANSTKALGRQAKLDIIHGATDASDFVKANRDLPVVVFGCDQWDRAHQVDEYTTISSYLGVIQALKHIAIDYFN